MSNFIHTKHIAVREDTSSLIFCSYIFANGSKICVFKNLTSINLLQNISDCKLVIYLPIKIFKLKKQWRFYKSHLSYLEKWQRLPKIILNHYIRKCLKKCWVSIYLSIYIKSNVSILCFNFHFECQRNFFTVIQSKIKKLTGSSSPRILLKSDMKKSSDNMYKYIQLGISPHGN